MGKRLEGSLKKCGVAPQINVSIDEDQCKGCGICVAVCPWDVVTMGEELSEKGYRRTRVTAPQRCVACGRCVALCPDFAIVVQVGHLDETG